MSRPGPLVKHASAVAFRDRGLLILGASGAGKSALALALIARGAALIADDRTCLAHRHGRLVAWSPAAILGRIEARGIGILAAQPAPPTAIGLVVDLDRAEPERIPPNRTTAILGLSIPLILAGGQPCPADALIQMLRLPPTPT